MAWTTPIVVTLNPSAAWAQAGSPPPRTTEPPEFSPTTEVPPPTEPPDGAPGGDAGTGRRSGSGRSQPDSGVLGATLARTGAELEPLVRTGVVAIGTGAAALAAERMLARRQAKREPATEGENG